MSEPPTDQTPDEGRAQKSTAQKSMSQRMGLAALILSGSIFLSRILGFAREAVIAYMFGAGKATDAYYAAFTLPDLMNYFLAGGTLSITFIPLFSAHVAKGDEAGGWKLFSVVATTMGVILVGFVIVLELLASSFVPLLNPGFADDPAQLELAVTMTRIVIPAQLAFYIGGLLQATLFVREVFWPAALAPLIYNACIIAGGLLLGPYIGIEGFAVGVVAGALLGPLCLPLWAARRHIEFRPRFDLGHPEFKRFILLSLPLMVGVSLVTVDEWVLRYFGSMSQDGAITWLNNARKMMLVLFAVIGQAAGQAALPYLTRLYHEGRESEMGKMLAQSLQRVGFLALIGAAGLIVTAEPLIFLVFRRGEFTASDAQATAALLVLFALGLLSWATQALAVRGFYARKDTLTPMLIGTVVVAIALPIYWALYDAFGVWGLAGGTSIGISLNALATVLVYRWRTGALPLGPIAAGLGRGAIFAAAAGAAAWGVRHLASPHVTLDAPLETFGMLCAMGVAFFGAIVAVGFVWRPPEYEAVASRIMARLRR